MECVSEQVQDHLIDGSAAPSPLNVDDSSKRGLTMTTQARFMKERKSYLEGFYSDLVKNDIERAHQISM
jgi:hypothetical protein